MARKKAEPTVPEVVETPVVTKKPVRRFVGKKFAYHHPFQHKDIPVGGDGVVLEMDSWLDSQVKAGFIVEV